MKIGIIMAIALGIAPSLTSRLVVAQSAPIIITQQSSSMTPEQIRQEHQKMLKQMEQMLEKMEQHITEMTPEEIQKMSQHHQKMKQQMEQMLKDMHEMQHTMGIEMEH